MGKHLTATEMDRAHALRASGCTPMEVHGRLHAARRRGRKEGPSLSTVRRALKGQTFKRSGKETRGRPRILTTTNLRTANRARKELIKKAKGEKEIHWRDIVRAARLPPVHRTTLAKNMQAAGYGIAWRTPRLKPARGEIDETERMEMCDDMRKLPLRFWLHDVDAFIDCKDWDLPLTVRGKSHVKRLRVRGHLRTKSEGLRKGFTKPDKKKHRQNTGGHAKLFAAIIGCRARVWHYLPRRWTGAAAAAVYTDVLAPALRRHRGVKRRYAILEDNDPTGFKSKKGLAAKEAAHIHPFAFPKYSPDLNPLDFSLWEEVTNRMAAQPEPKRGSAQAY